MDIVNYITGKALYLVPVLYVIGSFLKNTPKIPDWLIPWILTGLGVVGGLFTIGLNFDGVIQGVLAAGATVLGNQLYKQASNKGA